MQFQRQTSSRHDDRPCTAVKCHCVLNLAQRRLAKLRDRLEQIAAVHHSYDAFYDVVSTSSRAQRFPRAGARAAGRAATCLPHEQAQGYRGGVAGPQGSLRAAQPQQEVSLGGRCRRWLRPAWHAPGEPVCATGRRAARRCAPQSLTAASAAACSAAACREESSKPPPLRPGKVSPMLLVPAHIQRPPYADSGSMPDWDPNPQVGGVWAGSAGEGRPPCATPAA